ncbi:MAG: ATP-binding cassette domain-containing protein [Salinigranum sp.]
MPRRLEVENLAGERGGKRVVEDVSFAVDVDEWVALVGPSGAGKSSLLRLLNRLDEPVSGTVRLRGVDYRDIEPTALRRRVGLVAQRPALQPGTVRENVTVGPRLREEPIPEERVETILDGLGLRDLADRDADGLSGGEGSRVMLARTLVNDPEVLLLDEPTASLDAETTGRVEALLARTLEADECAVVFVTHDEDQAVRLGDRILELRDGTIAGEVAVGEGESR